ncbi:hypothetical protein ACQKP7_10490 [Pseudomonas frederiksbergensis]
MNATHLNEETSTALGTVIAIIQECGFFQATSRHSPRTIYWSA